MTQQDMLPGKALAELLSDKWLPSDVGDATVRGLCVDHRQLAQGELFIALAGSRTDGRRFINDAIALGAAAVLKEADSADEKIRWQGAVPIIPYVGLSAAVGSIAAEFHGNPSRDLQVIGVTGTNGKSTCTHLFAQLCALAGKKSAVVGTLGYGCFEAGTAQAQALTETGLTTADPVANQRILAQLREAGAQAVAMEVSSHSLDQHRVAAIEFTAALFTNLTRDHLDYHGDMKAYGLAKRKLFEQPKLRHRIFNIDDNFGRQLAALFSARSDAKTWTYSLCNEQADLHLSAVEHLSDGVRAQLSTPWGSGQLRSALLGDFNLSNLLGVIALACVAGLDFERILQSLPLLKPVAGRMEQVGGSDVNVVVDYAHTPDSLEQALKALRAHASGKLWCVFGCGGDRDRGKRPLMGASAEQLADLVVVTSDNPRSETQAQIASDIRAGFQAPEQVMFVNDRAAAIREAIHKASTGDTILIAGKGHETYQQVGENRLPFDDVKQARLALQLRTKGNRDSGLDGSSSDNGDEAGPA